MFHEARKVIDALQNKEVAPALAWCADNKSRLKKSKVYTFFACLTSLSSTNEALDLELNSILLVSFILNLNYSATLVL